MYIDSVKKPVRIVSDGRICYFFLERMMILIIAIAKIMTRPSHKRYFPSSPVRGLLIRFATGVFSAARTVPVKNIEIAVIKRTAMRNKFVFFILWSPFHKTIPYESLRKDKICSSIYCMNP